MKTKRNKLLVMLMALVLTVAGTVMAVAAAIPSKSDFSVIVNTDKDSYEDGEEVNLSIKVENNAKEAEITKVELSYDISETLQSKIVDYDKLPTTLDSLKDGLTDVFETYDAGTGENGGNDGGNDGQTPNTGIADTVVLFLGVMLIAAGVVLAIRSGYFKKIASIFMVVAMVVSLNGVSSLTAEASVPASIAKYEITGSKTVKYAGEDCVISITVIITIDADAKVEATDTKIDVSSRVSVHDPSIVKEGDTYYIFGSHMAWAKSTDLVNWKSFTNNINRDYKTIFAESAAWAANGGTQGSTTGAYDVSGNLWAPDVIYNEAMGKWCMYMSVNGDHWYSSIVLLTADHLDGDWTYVDTVVYSGFTSKEQAEKTDFYDVYTGTDFPARYNNNRNGNHTYGMNCIDPGLFYDQDGTLWMTYGSWFGGIYMIELDAATGLRDMSHTYKTVDGESDEYQGIKIAGGNHVSGEASYVQYIDGYYYLFMSYGGLVANGGYSMRIFRSEKPEGPYVDMDGNDARYLAGNTGAGNINGNVGIKLMTYYQWSYAKYGQVAQGHNSAFTDNDGKSYVVYHTRTNDGTEGHSVRVHQLFTNEDGWLVAAPYEYRGEAISQTGYTSEEMAGTYEVLYHRQSINYNGLECVTSQELTLNADGTVTGDYTGTWKAKDGSPYVTMTLGGVEYNGVFVKQYIEETDYQTLCFAILGDNEVEVWGSKYLEGKDAVDFTLANNMVAVPSLALDDIAFTTEGLYGTTISYKSSDENVISNEGKVKRASEEKTVTITATFVNGDYSVDKEYSVTVPSSESTEMLLAEYYVNGESFDLSGTTTVPNAFNKDVTAGINVYNGIALEFDVKGTGSALSNIWGFTDAGNGKYYFAGGSYLGYNATGGYFDANLENYGLVTDYINGEASFRIEMDDCGFDVYVNGELAYNSDQLKSGELKGGYSITNYCNVLNWLNESATVLNLGTGNWWTDQKFAGSISNIRFYASEGETVDTSGYEYYDDFNQADISGWISPNAADEVVTGNDGDSYRSYFTVLTGGASGNRTVYKELESAISGDFTLEFDTKLTAGNIIDRSEAALVIGSSDAAGYKSNSVATGGYVVKLFNNYTANGATTWVLNDTEEVSIPSNTWIHVKAVVDSANGQVEITITNSVDGTEIYSGTVATSGAGDMSVIQILRGRGAGTASLDNITVVK